MMCKPHYLPGEPVVLRRVWQNRIYRVTTMTVVQDTPDLIVLYLGPGYPIKSANNPLKASSAQSFELQDSTWGGGIKHLLMLVSPGAAHAVYAMKNEEHHVTGWYINLQEPLSRTAFGFDTTDYLLDITFPPIAPYGNGRMRRFSTRPSRQVKFLMSRPATFAWKENGRQSRCKKARPHFTMFGRIGSLRENGGFPSFRLGDKEHSTADGFVCV
ncbi:DUF402 domain-containing protein [Paenibacillus sp. GYB003]|uniref:DUF402 domain-containing protein n=1 Tax=Paenibacillus sp. GYB003 TaxID=2994392 RepID=UPI003FA7DCA4